MEMLECIPDLEILSACDSGIEAAKQVDALKPELIFLDIHLSDISGIDMLHLLSHHPAIIFTTAYDQYALKAFELRAVDYLLKPYSEERLHEAVERARDQISPGENMNVNILKIKDLLSHWQPEEHYLKRIPSKVGDKIYILNEDDIIYFDTKNKLIFAHLSASKHMINYTLEELQARLDPEKFFRIHRSTIVNLNYVKTIEAWFAGGYKMTVRDKQGSELLISRSAGKLLRKKLGW